MRRRRRAAISGHYPPHRSRQCTGRRRVDGLADFRLYWPEERMAYLGMLMVASATSARAWPTGMAAARPLAGGGRRHQTVRLGVEQFNPETLLFFQKAASR